MNKDLIDTALRALDALIADALVGTSPGRYVAMARLCAQADRLRQMGIARVADVDNNDDVGEDYVGAVGFDVPLAPRRLRLPENPINNVADLARTLADTVNRRPTPTTAEQIEQMVRVRGSMLAMRLPAAQMAPIDDRITALTTALAKENTDAPAHRSDVVPAQLLRGHPAEGDVGHDVRPPHDGADQAGAGCAPLAGRSRPEGGVDGAGHDADRGEDRAQGADRPGRGGAGEAPQARSDDDLRRPVQGRDDGGDPHVGTLSVY